MDENGLERVKIDRHIYDQEQLHQEFHYEKPKKKILDSGRLSCSNCQPKNVLLQTIPVLHWLPQYKWKQDFPGDLVSGITVAIMHIPQGMAYSLLGNVPAVVGIYMAFFPVLIYFLLGTSKHNSMGTFAIVCLMTGKVVLEHSHPSYFSKEMTQNSTLVIGTEIHYSPIEVATVVTFTVALFQFLMYVLRLGIISTLLSETLISGFTTGTAFQVLTSQVKDIIGLEIPKQKGYFVVINTFKSISENFTDVNHVAITISAVTIIVMVINNEAIKPKIARKTSFPIPIELIVVIFGTFVSQYWKLDEFYDVQIVGHIPNGFPPPLVPKLSLMKDIVLDAFTIAVVSYAMSLSMSLIFAQKLNYKVDANQELLAQSAGNMMGSFFSCMPFTASMSRSLIQQTVGGKTQMTSLVSCGILVLILMWIGPLFEPLPKSVLASIIVVSLKGMFVNVVDFKRYWKLSKLDAFVWMSTFLTVILVGIDIGLCVGILLSLFTVVFLGFKPYTCLLGSISLTDIYLDLSRYKLAKEIHGVKIFHFQGGINFASRNIFKSELYRLVNIDPQKELKRQRKAAKIQDSLANLTELKDNKLNTKYSLKCEVKCIVLDFSGVSYIDPSGISTLKSLIEEFQMINVTIYLSACNGPIYEMLQKCDFKNSKINLRIFPTIHDAVQNASEMFGLNISASISVISENF